jgi:hypothetical protein
MYKTEKAFTERDRVSVSLTLTQLNRLVPP